MSLPKEPGSFEDFYSENNLEVIFREKFQKARFVGVDGVNAKSFKNNLRREVEIIARKVKENSYQFTRYKEKLILKSASKPPRQISIPTIRDALVLRALCDFLTSKFPEQRMRPPHENIKKISANILDHTNGDCFLRMDVVNFYPSIDHEILLKQVSNVISEESAITLLSNAIKTRTGFSENKNNMVSVPQGLSISNILSMIYLSEADVQFAKKYCYTRYVDDILIICDSEKAIEVHDDVAKSLQESLNIETHPLSSLETGKTTIQPFSKGTEYLGFRISDQDLQIRERSYKKMFHAIMGDFSSLKGKITVEQFLWRLNLKITGCRFEERSVGWVFYFRQAKDIKQFHRMNTFVQKQLKIHGLSEHKEKVLCFVKTYREILYNREKTNYIPNFDNFTLANKIRTVALLTGQSTKEIAKLDRNEIDETYFGLIKRQIARLERETVDFGNGYY